MIHPVTAPNIIHMSKINIPLGNKNILSLSSAEYQSASIKKMSDKPTKIDVIKAAEAK